MTKKPLEITLVGLNELTRMDRWELERRSRALAQPVYLGEKVALCRFMGRYKMFVSTRDIGFGAHLILDGFWESWLTTFMAQRVKPGMHVVDAGANHGYYTTLFADIVGAEGRVAAIEPNPSIAQLLRQTIAVNGFASRVTVFEKALTDEDDIKLTFHAVADEPKNARIVDSSWDSSPHTSTIYGARLDTLLAEWPRIDFMKIDVEGAEEGMIHGSSHLIERDRPSLVLEFNMLRCRDPKQLLDYLESLYGKPSVIDFDAKAKSITTEALMDPSRTEDWLLYYSA